jgi:hypothetical protein
VSSFSVGRRVTRNKPRCRETYIRMGPDLDVAARPWTPDVGDLVPNRSAPDDMSLAEERAAKGSFMMKRTALGAATRQVRLNGSRNGPPNRGLHRRNAQACRFSLPDPPLEGLKASSSLPHADNHGEDSFTQLPASISPAR